MKGLNIAEARDDMVSRINTRAYPALQGELPAIIEAFLSYDLQFMRMSGVLDEAGESGPESYDEDEALEYILDAYLAGSGKDEKSAAEVLSLLNEYMEWQYAYFEKHGLAE